jgi:heme exporter protein D
LSYAVYLWNAVPMSFAQLARVVVPSVTSLALGAQTVLYSFFLSILELRRA